MRNYHCPNCGQTAPMEKLNLKRTLKDRINECEEWGIYYTCPLCTIDSEVEYQDLPEEVKNLFSPER